MNSIACRPFVALMTSIRAFEQCRQGKDVAGVVVDDEHLASAEHVVGVVHAFEHLLLFRRQIGDNAVQEQGRLVEQTLGGLNILKHDTLGHGLDSASSSADRSLPVKTTTGRSRRTGFVLNLFEQFESRHIGQTQVEHDAIEQIDRARPRRLRRQSRQQ